MCASLNTADLGRRSVSPNAAGDHRYRNGSDDPLLDLSGYPDVLPIYLPKG